MSPQEEPYVQTDLPPDPRYWPDGGVLVFAWQHMPGWHIRALVSGAKNVNEAMKAVVAADSALNGVPVVGVKLDDKVEKKVARHKQPPPVEVPPPTVELEDLPAEGEPLETQAGSILGRAVAMSTQP